MSRSRVLPLGVALVLAATVAGCGRDAAPSIPAAVRMTAGSGAAAVELTRLTEAVWMHTSTAEYGGSAVAANGLVVVTDDGVVLVDTPWTPGQTAALDELVDETFDTEIIGAVVTHAHPDRLGGAPYLAELGVPITSLAVVAEQAEATGYVVPDDVREGEWAGLTIGGTDLEVYYPGAGHTVDNTVVWIPKEAILFGGCLVKDQASTSLGSVDEADLDAWPDAIADVQARYGEADVVVPGHGSVGDAAMLDHTLELLAG
jgi:metallo-beta-lactamase class B